MVIFSMPEMDYYLIQEIIIGPNLLKAAICVRSSLYEWDAAFESLQPTQKPVPDFLWI